MTEKDPKSGAKFRKLTELKPTAAQEYQEAMLKRVEHFSQKRESSFNSLLENTVVDGLKFLLDFKVKFDDMLGDENRKKFNDAFEKLLLFGL